MEKLINGGNVRLWGGWIVSLPPACHERNQDGSWSAWGEDWTIDVTIIETSGNADGEGISADLFLMKRQSQEKISGRGWLGMRELFSETDNGRSVLRLATTLCAPYSIMNCWVSFFDKGQVKFAESLIAGIAHEAKT